MLKAAVGGKHCVAGQLVMDVEDVGSFGKKMVGADLWPFEMGCQKLFIYLRPTRCAISQTKQRGIIPSYHFFEVLCVCYSGL
jgi:hypothetical protein